VLKVEKVIQIIKLRVYMYIYVEKS
jgi:hypothetical protein